MFAFAQQRPRRKPALTPLIDVVFLLLVFFMLAAQFGREGALDLVGGAGDDAYSGPPRLVTIQPEATLLNGVVTPMADLLDALHRMVKTSDDIIVLRAGEKANVQRLTDVVQQLTAAGFSKLVLVE